MNEVEVEGHGWTLLIWRIATLFHKPVLAAGCNRVGWNAKQGRFLFPRFGLYVNGNLDATASVIQQHATPCQSLPKLETEALGQDHAAVQIVWAAAGYFAPQLLSPLMG